MKAVNKPTQTTYKDTEGLLSAWEEVLLARHMKRPRSRFYIEQIFDSFIETHGDRAFADDQAIITGIGKIGDKVVTLIAQSRGNDAKENLEVNFGMPHPEGYRKALRAMKQAEKFKRPIICLIDTPGAYCGIGAEERGQGEAIARNLIEMIQIKVPIISGIIGEGGSGGALALGIADRMFMQEHAVYSILSPEGFATILWKDAKRAQEAAEQMQMTAEALLSYHIIDDIIKEPYGGAHKNPVAAANQLKQYLLIQLDALSQIPQDEYLEMRYNRYRHYGVDYIVKA